MYCKDVRRPIDRECPDCVNAVIHRARIADTALRKIAFEPIGDPEASDREVLAGIVEVAIKALECERSQNN